MDEREAWSAAFLAELERPFAGDRDALLALLERQIAAARQSWPGVQLEPRDFAAALARKLDAEVDPLVEVAKLRIIDLYLAVAVAVDAPGALAAFEERILSRVPAFVARTGAAPALVEEAAQQLRIKLLVGGNGSPARINQYSGHGALESWVCAVAVRLVRDLQRGDARRRHADADELDVLAASDDPELELLRARHQDEFRGALRETIEQLPPRQRTLLRLQFFERLTTVEIGRLYRVNQSTAWRWMGEARQAVLDGVKQRLRKRLAMTASELDSLLNLLHSQLDISFQRLLADDKAASSS